MDVFSGEEIEVTLEIRNGQSAETRVDNLLYGMYIVTEDDSNLMEDMALVEENMIAVDVNEGEIPTVEFTNNLDKPGVETESQSEKNPEKDPQTEKATEKQTEKVTEKQTERKPDNTNSVQTLDSTQIIPYIILLLAAAACIIVLVWTKKKKRKSKLAT